jgi:hypothetical protein
VASEPWVSGNVTSAIPLRITAGVRPNDELSSRAIALSPFLLLVRAPALTHALRHCLLFSRRRRKGRFSPRVFSSETKRRTSVSTSLRRICWPELPALSGSVDAHFDKGLAGLQYFANYSRRAGGDLRKDFLQSSVAETERHPWRAVGLLCCLGHKHGGRHGIHGR